MEKHTESTRGGQAQGLSPWHIPCYKCGHGFPKGQLRGRWAAEFDTSPHVGRVGQHPQLGGHVFGGLAQGDTKLIITHGRSVDDQAGIVFTAFSEAQRGHGRLPDKAAGGQHDHQKAIQHCPLYPRKNSRAQHNLNKGQQPINTCQEPGMHHFDGMAVVQNEPQFMSYHLSFPRPVALPPEPGGWVNAEPFPVSARVVAVFYLPYPDHRLVLPYSLQALGDRLIAFTLAGAKSLSLAGRGPALRASIFDVAYRTTSPLTMEEARARTQPPAFPGTQQHGLRRPGGRHA